MSLRINYTVAVAAPNTAGIAALQTLSGAGSLTLTSPSVVVGSGYGQLVTLTSAANLSAVNFTVTGTMPGDPAKVITSTVAGPNATTVNVDYFATVTSVTASAGFNPNQVSVGWTNKGISPALPCDVRQTPFAIGLGCVIESGTPLYSVQHTFSQMWNRDQSPIDPLTWQWFTNASINNIGVSTDGNYAFPVSAIRLLVNGTGTVSFRGYQAVVGNG